MKTQEQQHQEFMAYANFDENSLYDHCEECAAKIPPELSLCPDCAWEAA